MGPSFTEEVFTPLNQLEDCAICPRNCHANRADGELGYCRSGKGFGISSVFAHRGEEPVLSGSHGICNIFFTHCNMQCRFCQNHQISRNTQPNSEMELSSVLGQIESILDSGATGVGFVSPSHYLLQVKVIISALKSRGRNPVYVFNTNGYDRKEAIASLEDEIDVYLPDLKYMDEELAERYSGAPDYPAVAGDALKEMFRQKGSSIFLDDNGVIEAGMIIRHLVLPGQVENSKQCLRFIAEELSPSVHISLMSQYYPTPMVSGFPELDRYVSSGEYDEVLEEFERLGFYRGWVQDLESPHCYRPDFDGPDVFE